MIESPRKMIKNEIQKSRIGTELENVTTIGRLKDHFEINFGSKLKS